MVQMDMDNFISDQPRYCKGTPLLEKYNIPITHLDFDYVEKCSDGKELEKILHILQSGQEGHYPDLIRAVEERLIKYKPKSRLLRKKNRVICKNELDHNDWKQISNDLDQWFNNVDKENRELEAKKSENQNLNKPDVRKEQKDIIDNTKQKKNSEKRIKSTDYSSWDKYDPDTEILKMDLEEERIKNEVVAKFKPEKPKKTVKFNIFATEAEATFEANREREKGNEYFKAKEYDNAVTHYTASLECKRTVQCYNNRAIAYLKKSQFEEAIKDCDAALAIEPDNFKSLLRKATALSELKRYDEALSNAEKCVRVNPNDAEAQKIAMQIRKNCKNTLKNKRFVVEDISHKCEESIINNKEMHLTKEETSKSEEIIPIPGTSKMPPPYYLTCPNSPNSIKRAMSKVNSSGELIRFVSLIISDDEDDDYVVINDAKNKPNDLKKLDKAAIKNEIKFKDEQPKTSRKSDKLNTPVQYAKVIKENDKVAGGEPFIKEDEFSSENINQPYSFLKLWSSVGNDPTFKKYADILHNMNVHDLVRVIGNKMDSNMFSLIIRCLCMHFTVPSEVATLYIIMTNIAQLPRFNIIAMLMSDQDRKFLNIIIEFLKQHDRSLPQGILERYN